MLFEKYIWLEETCNGICPVCSSEPKFEKAHDTIESLMEDYIVNIEDNIKIKNLSDKIINSMNIYADEDKLLIFVKENSFINVVNQVLRDLENYNQESNNSEMIRFEIMENLKKNNPLLYRTKRGNFIFFIILFFRK